MLKASTCWLVIRGDFLSVLLITSVSAGALFATQSPGNQLCRGKFAVFSFILVAVFDKLVVCSFQHYFHVAV